MNKIEKILLGTGIVMSSLLPINTNGQIIPKDKKLHLGAGAAIGAWFYSTSHDRTGWRPVIYGMVGATGAGTLKELYDLVGGGNPEAMDLVATMTGGALSIGLIKLCSIKRKPKLMAYGIVDDKKFQLKLVYTF